MKTKTLLKIVAGYRFRSNGLSEIDSTVEQIEEMVTKLDVRKTKGPDGIGNIPKTSGNDAKQISTTHLKDVFEQGKVIQLED